MFEKVKEAEEGTHCIYKYLNKVDCYWLLLKHHAQKKPFSKSDRHLHISAGETWCFSYIYCLFTWPVRFNQECMCVANASDQE